MPINTAPAWIYCQTHGHIEPRQSGPACPACYDALVRARLRGGPRRWGATEESEDTSSQQYLSQYPDAEPVGSGVDEME